MKIQRINITRNQFKNFELDLRYPQGHPKAGKALDKVCFIGQSGTGKTTLLNAINRIVLSFNHKTLPSEYNFLKFEHGEGIGAVLEDTLDRLLVRQVLTNSFGTKLETTNLHKKNTYIFASEDERLSFENQVVVKTGIYFPAGIPHLMFAEKMDFHDNVSKEEFFEQYSLVAEPNIPYNTDLLSYFQFGSKDSPLLWKILYNQILKYQKSEFEFRVTLTKRAEQEVIDIKNEMTEWKRNNPNPLEDLAKNCLDKILKEFHLQTKTSIDKLSEIESIQIKLLNSDKTIPYESLSTGIRQIIFTAFPIFSLLRENSIVLMDEPETSLYPDLQRKIIPYYTSFDKTNGEDCQFFFATHSPIIASSFEPWEIVELKFDENGFVYREQYWEGENHVDNYKYYPQYLRWDGILQHIFDLENDGSELRKEMLQQFSNLDNKLKERKRNGETLSKDDAEVKELMEMGKKLGWNTKQE